VRFGSNDLRYIKDESLSLPTRASYMTQGGLWVMWKLRAWERFIAIGVSEASAPESRFRLSPGGLPQAS
jgi:hypothetical protein